MRLDKYGAMVMVISGIVFFKEPMRDVAFFKATTDSASERLLIINRRSGAVVWHCRTDGGTTIKKILPVEFANNKALTFVLFDDSFANNAAVIDGVQCQLIDASTFDMLNA